MCCVIIAVILAADLTVGLYVLYKFKKGGLLP